MKKIITLLGTILLTLGLVFSNVFAATSNEEMRAVWISTVYNLDYPSTKNNVEAQKAEFIQKLDALQKVGINTVVVQVRPKGDALYESAINPWSEFLTGTQGKYPGYDPMAFMIEEVHKRNMAFHAWLNPYRVTTSGTDANVLASGHPAKLHPEWLITYNNALYYNPESAEVKQHIVETVKEIVKNYDIDGIHFDDYFYPASYPLPAGEDKNGEVANMRRAHINEMIKQVGQAVKSIDKGVQFGVSPAGIWKNSTSDPTGSNTGGGESYYNVYADTRTWIQNAWIDYVVPQIYWETGHKLADYETLVKWWTNEVKGTNVNLYIGQGIYKDTVASEITKELVINQKYQVKGSFYFSLRDLLNNRQNCQSAISNFYTVTQPIELPPRIPVENIATGNQSPEQQVQQAQKETIGVTGNQAVGKTGNVIADTLNIRSGARTDRPIVTKVSKGTKLDILSFLDGWYKVKLSNQTVGWASAAYIKVQTTSITSSAVTQSKLQTAVTGQTKLGTVTASSLNIRSGASVQRQVITKVAKGTKLAVLDRLGDWYKIKLATGKVGWANKAYIS